MLRARSILLLGASLLAGCHLLIAHAPADHGAGERGGREAGGRDAPGERGDDRAATDRTTGEPPLPACDDGTPLGACSARKPLRCVALPDFALPDLDQDCKVCGCPAGSVCGGKRCQGTLEAAIDADAQLEEPMPGTNLGSKPTLRIGREWNGESRAILGFDLSSIPPKSLIESATFALTVVSWSGTALPIEARLVETPWAEAQVTWSNAPKAIAFPVATGTLTWSTNLVDVRSLIAAWTSSHYVRYGLILRPAGTEKNGLQVASREATIAMQRPRLTIVFR